jgi:ubiquinone/menaquinone biosynthesis C-methylase UbiE
VPHRFDPKNIEHLDGEERRRLVDVEAILSSLPLQPRQTLADIGCGTGFFTLPLAQRVSEGKVYALDIADEMLDRLRQRVAEGGAGNVEVLKCGELDFPVPKGAMDGVLVAFVLHEQEDRLVFLEKVRELLKPGGWISVLEWEKKETKMGPPVAERIDQVELRHMASKAGLDFAFAKQLSDSSYMAVLKRLDGGPGMTRRRRVSL